MSRHLKSARDCRVEPRYPNNAACGSSLVKPRTSPTHSDPLPAKPDQPEQQRPPWLRRLGSTRFTEGRP